MSHEAVRYWGRKFGQSYANQLRRQRPRPGDTWHLDEAFLTINGARSYLWRAVDQDDTVLDILVQSRRNKQAAKKFFKKLLTGLHYVPRVIITDTRKSYAAAKREVMPGVEHRHSRYLNNRCENPTGPPGNGSDGCSGSNRQDMPNGFCRHMAPLPNTFDPGATFWRRLSTGRKCGTFSDVAGDHRHGKGSVRGEYGGPPRSLRLVIVSR